MTVAKTAAEIDDLKAQVRLGVEVSEDLMRIIDRIQAVNAELVADVARLQSRLAQCEAERDTWRAAAQS